MTRRLDIVALMLLALGCGGPVPPAPVSEPATCALSVEAEILVRDGAAELVRWTLPYDAALFGPELPDDPGLAAYRRAVADAGADLIRPPVPTPAEATAAEAQVWERERANADLVYSGRAGRVRPIHCLEAILFARQHRRHSQLAKPTEFIASLLRRGDRLRVYAGAGDQLFPPKSVYGFDRVERDVADGWRLEAVLHNHTIREVGGRMLLGPPVPSTVDVALMRGLAGSLALEQVLVTNGLYTGEVPTGALDQFDARE